MIYLYRGSFPHYIREQIPKISGAHRHTSMYTYASEYTRVWGVKSLAVWKFAMETHLWINIRKLRHITREEKKQAWIFKLLNSITLGSVTCVFQEQSLFPAWKMFHGLTLLLRAYVLTSRAEDFTECEHRPKGNISILFKQKQETVFSNTVQKKHLETALRHCSQTHLCSISHLSLHKWKTIEVGIARSEFWCL